MEEGKIDIIIGTHGLLGKDVKFKDLGLMVIDEEQKFGVAHKEKLKHLRTTVDCLTLTATPIPRTLQFQFDGRKRSEHHQYAAAQPAADSNRSAGI